MENLQYQVKVSISRNLRHYIFLPSWAPVRGGVEALKYWYHTKLPGNNEISRGYVVLESKNIIGLQTIVKLSTFKDEKIQDRNCDDFGFLSKRYYDWATVL